MTNRNSISNNIESCGLSQSCLINKTHDKYLSFFVSQHLYREGIFNRFKYNKKNYNLFCENRSSFLRVIAMFTIYLSSTSNTHIDNKKFIVMYNLKNRTILQCNLLWVLICAYYKTVCNGCIYVINDSTKYEKNIMSMILMLMMMIF